MNYRSKINFNQPEHPEKAKNKKLFKSNSDKIIAGVCGGIADYLNINAFWIRLIFLLFLLPCGFTAFVYFIAAVCLPKEKTKLIPPKTAEHNYLLGVTLIFFSASIMIINSPIFYTINIFRFSAETAESLSLILAGVFFVVKTIGNQKYIPSVNVPSGKIKSSKVNLFISKYLGINTNAINMLWVIFIFLTMGFGLVIYFLLTLIVRSSYFES